MNAIIRDVDEEIEAAQVEAAREDPACFAQYVLRDEQSNDPISVVSHQVQWHDLMTESNRLLIWSSIGSGKTQHISIARVLWEIGKNPRIRIVILSASRALAQKISRTLRRYIENSPELHRVFPDLKPGAVWNEYSFTVKGAGYAKDPTVQVLGLHGKILGSRTDLLIVDDVLDVDNTATPELRAKTTSWVKSTPMSRLDRNSRMWVVGTAFHREDFLHHLAGMRSFKSVKFPIVERDDMTGALISRWPSAWPMDRINQWKEDHGELEFARQLMCEARSDDDSRFRQDWIDWAKAAGAGKQVAYMLEQVPMGYRTFTGVDLGVQQHRKADPTSLDTIVVHPNGNREILCIETGRWTGPDILARLADTQRRYQSTLVVENNAAQDFIRQFAAQAGIHTIPVTTGRQKLHPELGIEGLAIELQRRQWIFPSERGRCHPEIEKLIGEMLWYDPSRHTGDRLMALWIAREGIRLTAAPTIRAEVGQLRLLQR